MTRKKDDCRTDGCHDEVIYPNLGYCAACYAWHWDKKNNYTVAGELEYLEKQDRIAARCEDRKRVVKARPMPRKKTRAA